LKGSRASSHNRNACQIALAGLAMLPAPFV
jgi:hypothetical protein